MIKVILWDIDGTLLDFHAAERRALQDCFEAFSLGPCPDDRVSRYSVINLKWWKMLERGEITKAQLLPGRFREFFQAEGIVFDEFAALNDLYQRKLGEHVFFMENSYELVRDLRKQVHQYAVTNGTKIAQDGKLARSGLGELMDGVFISEDVGAEKPSLAFFERVFQAIGPYEKEEMLIVGDSLTSDMLGGSRAGIPCCWYNPQGAPCPEELGIRYDIRHLDQVRDILAEVNGPALRRD